MAVWPFNTTTHIINGSFKETPPNNTIRSKMEVGPEKIRRRTTANVRPISFVLRLTEDELDTLDEFYNDDTYSGADEFDFTHPRTAAAVKARFIQPPEYGDVKKGQYQVVVQLEILP